MIADLFDSPGQWLKAEGIKSVTDHNTDWVEGAVNKIKALLVSNPEITSEDLNGIGPPPHPNAVGAAFNVAAARGLIERTGFRRSGKPSAHGRFISVWRRRTH